MAHTKQNLPRGYGVNRETMAHSKQHLPRATCEWADFGPYQAELTKGLRCEWGDWSTLSRTYQKATLWMGRWPTLSRTYQGAMMWMGRFCCKYQCIYVLLPTTESQVSSVEMFCSEGWEVLSFAGTNFMTLEHWRKMITDHCITKSSCKFDLEADYNLASFFSFFMCWTFGGQEKMKLNKSIKSEERKWPGWKTWMTAAPVKAIRLPVFVVLCLYIYANQVEVTSDS